MRKCAVGREVRPSFVPWWVVKIIVRRVDAGNRNEPPAKNRRLASLRDRQRTTITRRDCSKVPALNIR